MGAMFDYLDAEEGGAEDMIKHALGKVIELNDKICCSPGGPEKTEFAARAGLQAATVLLYVYGHAHEEERNWWDRRSCREMFTVTSSSSQVSTGDHPQTHHCAQTLAHCFILGT